MTRTVRYTVLVLIAIINSLVITTSLYAVLPYNELHQLNMSNGLVDNIITCIYQDQDRFMWFGSSNGLSRYDGKQIRNFSVDNARTVSYTHLDGKGKVTNLRIRPILDFVSVWHFYPIRLSE